MEWNQLHAFLLEWNILLLSPWIVGRMQDEHKQEENHQNGLNPLLSRIRIRSPSRFWTNVLHEEDQ